MRNHGTSPLLLPILVAGVLGVWSVAAGAENIDPAADGHQYAWGENVGWINSEPSGEAGPGVEVADFKLTGWMWGENIGWINLSCENDSVCGATDYGVRNDGFGKLSGFAWAENVGWINFRPTTCAVDPTCGVRIDSTTGYFTGRAWGENVGWITFSSGAPAAWTTRTIWCSNVAAAPGAGFTLSVSKSGPDVLLSWTALPSTSWYDVIGGKLSTLHGSGGDFSASTDLCIAGRLAATSSPASGPSTVPGDGAWFLVRGANCKGGTYDTGLPSQQGSRDAEIAASPSSCH